MNRNRSSTLTALAKVAGGFRWLHRVEEVGRLTWDKVDLEAGRVTVEPEAAKKGKRRVNAIPENALEWLKLCKGSGKIAPNDYSQRMQRLRNAAGVNYPQNGMRHCFSAYHLAKCGDASKTAFQLGHPNAQLLYSTYYAVVASAEVAPFFRWYALGTVELLDNLFQDITNTAVSMMSGGWMKSSPVTFINNIVVNSINGVVFQDSWDGKVQDSIFVGCSNAVQVAGSLSRSVSYNDLFGNATNFVG